MYEFKKLEEVLWTVAIAVLTFVCATIVDTEAITDWRAYLAALGFGAIRSAAGAVLATLPRTE